MEELKVVGFVNDKHKSSEIKDEEINVKNNEINKKEEFIKRNRADADTIRRTEEIGRQRNRERIERKEREERKESKIVNISEGMQKKDKYEAINMPNNKERYKTSKSTRKKAMAKKKKARTSKILKKLFKKAMLYGTVGILAFGGVQKYQDYKEQQNNRPSLEAVLDNDITLNELGIDENIENKLEAMKEINLEELSNADLIKVTADLNELQFDIIKSKLGNVLGTENMNLWASSKDINGNITPASVEVNEKYITEQDWVDKICSKLGVNKSKQISSDIANFIEEIAKTQELAAETEKGNFDREKTIKICEESIEESDKFAATGVIKDGNVIKTVDASKLKENKTVQKEVDDDTERF